MSAHIYYYHDKEITVLKVTGSLRFNECAPLESFLKELSAPKAQHLVVDLSDTALLDSTALGLLAQIAIAAKKLTQSKPKLYCPDNDLKEVLLSMSLEQLFDFIEILPAIPNTLSELKISTEDEITQTQRAIDAHQTLMGLSKENKAEFKSVVELLEKSLPKK